MILRKTPSAFLRALRSIPQSQLPGLPEKKLSVRRQKRLEDAVFARIAKEQNRTIFDAEPTEPSTASDDAYVTYDSPFEMTVIGRGAWKRNLRRYAGGFLAACLCFAVLVTGVLYRHDIALYFAEHSWLVDTDAVSDHEDTQAIHEWTTDEALLAEPPENAVDAYHMQVTSRQITEDSVTMQLRLTSADDSRFTGTAIQYSRVALELWDPGVRRWILKYEDTLPYQPEAQIMAGDLHFNLIGLGAVNEAEMTLKLPMDLTDYQGVWRISLDGLTLVRDALPGETAEFGMTAEPFCEGVVWALFSSEEEPTTADEAKEENLAVRDTVTPPPQSAYPPNDLSEIYTLQVTDTLIKNNTVKLKMRLESKNELPLGHQIFYQTCEIELWNHEKQVWESKFGTDDSGVDFAKRLMAGDGDMQFWLGTQFEPAEAATAEISYPLPDDGWYRITLRGLVLVRDAQEHSVTPYQLVSEVIEEKGVYAVFYKEDTATAPPQSAHRPLLASDDYALHLSDTTVDGDTVTLDVVLETPNGNPDGYAVYYRTEETELWNHEKQIWEGKHGTDFGDDDTVFAKMLCAGEVHFTVDKTSGNTFDSIKVKLGDPGEYRTGWYRTTLTGLVLVREAKEGEEADFSNLVVEELDTGAVSVIYHIE